MRGAKEEDRQELHVGDVCEMFITDALRTGVGCVMSNQVSVLHAVVWCVAGCRGES